MKNSLDFLVGLFMIAGFAAFGYLALQLGEVSVFSSSKNYTIIAQFDNIAGVKKGASVQVAGVVVAPQRLDEPLPRIGVLFTHAFKQT